MRTRPSTFETGIPGLDTILGGGLSRDALIFLVGMPGAGKTVLGAQILFNAARRGEHGLILTGFSEGHVKLLKHLAPFSFFDPAVVGNEITLLSLQTIISMDVDAAAASLIRTARQSDTRIILIDGLQTLRSLLPSQDHVTLLLAALANQLTYLDVTLIVTVDGAPDQVHGTPEIILADVAINLHYTPDGWRRVRRLEVLKHRGHVPLNGSHTLVIDHDGLTLYPRLEALPLPPTPIPASTPRPMGFGVAELDRMLDGGLTSGTSTILGGAPGTGKTALGLAWALHSATPLAPTLFVSFSDSGSRLQQRNVTNGLDVQAAINEQAIVVMYVSPANIDPDRIGNQLLAMLQTTSIRRVVIDDLLSLTRNLGDRTFEYIAGLRGWFQHLGVTALFILPRLANNDFGLDIYESPFMLVAENVIVLKQQMVAQRLRRVLVVPKTALQASDNMLHEVVLDTNGIHVLAASGSAIRFPQVAQDRAAVPDDPEDTLTTSPQP